MPPETGIVLTTAPFCVTVIVSLTRSTVLIVAVPMVKEKSLVNEPYVESPAFTPFRPRWTETFVPVCQ